MKKLVKSNNIFSTFCSPLVIAAVLLNSSMAMADTSLTCTVSGGTNCPSPADSISDLLPPVVSTITVPAGSCAAGSVTDVNVNLDIAHSFVGDLTATLQGPGNVSQSVLLDQPGTPPGFGCGNNDVNALFDDVSATPAEGECAAGPAIAGTVSPSTPLTAFNTGDGDGVWTLTIVDNTFGDTGELNDWRLDIACASDTTPPVITAPADITTELTAILTPVTLGMATATDNLDPAPVITNNNPGSFFFLGDTTVTWTATDSSNNTATANQIVTIEDTTDPVVTAQANITQESNGTDNTPVSLGIPTVHDAARLLMATADNLGPYQLGTTLVTWTATDDSGNTGTDTQTVTILPCTNLTNLICVKQRIIVKRQQFCDAYIYIPATGGYLFTSSLFGLSQEVQADSFLISAIETRCGPPVPPT